MKSDTAFFSSGCILLFAGSCFLLSACATPEPKQGRKSAFALLTESSAGLGKAANQNPAELKRLFDLPADFFVPLTVATKSHNSIKHENGWLGIGMKLVSKDEPTSQLTAIEVAMVFPNSSAEEAHILKGDQIIGLGGSDFSPDSKDTLLKNFRDSIEAKGAGNPVQLKILSDGIAREIQVNLKAKPKASVDLPPVRPATGTTYPNSLLHYALKKEKLDEEFRRTGAGIRSKTAEVLSLSIREVDYNPFRLRQVNRIMHEPLELPLVAHELTEPLNRRFNKKTKNLPGLIRAGMDALDLEPASPHFIPVNTPGLAQYIEQLVKAFNVAGNMRDEALAKLNVEETNILYQGALDILKEDFDEEQETGLAAEDDEEMTEEEKLKLEEDLLRFFKTALQLDLARLLTAALQIALAIDLGSLPRLAEEPFPLRFQEKWTVREEPNLTTILTPAGKVLVGGPGNNVYREDAAIILDMGGDDRYLNRAGSGNRENPFSLVIDFSGNDFYAASDDFSQGAGILGAGFLIDLEGDDLYSAHNYSQGMGFFGVGMLVDLAGRDVYKSDGVSQGAGIFGVGLLAEGKGSDDYSATRFAQGFGFVKGYGAIVEVKGTDKYFAGGKYPDFRNPEKSYQSLSQGFGFGFRSEEMSIMVSGGVGILADAEGNDTYVGDYFAQGSSYWYALGILADKTGHDKYIAGRYSQGTGTHLTGGILVDGEGDDQYLATFGVSQGCGHDYAVGMLLDNGGNDRYIGGIMSQGAGNDNGFGILNDNGGDDEYHIKGLGRGRGNFRRDRDLGSFGLHFDTGGGQDYYSSDGKNNYLIFKTKWGIFADTH